VLTALVETYHVLPDEPETKEAPPAATAPATPSAGEAAAPTPKT
jgi:hypothetical protein